MINSIKLLDCTLREAPLEDLMWGDLPICKVIDGLGEAKVDIIEVGFLKNNQYKPGSTIFQRVEEIRPYLKHKKRNTLYTALVDYGRYDLGYLSEYDGTSIDAIRVCFKHNEINEVLSYARTIKEKGYQVCIQHVDTMGFLDETIVRFIHEVNKLKPFAYSVVDTFGAMYGSDAVHYTELAAGELDAEIWLGFHAHNNLILADANAQQFIENFGHKRKIIVDVSLYGCGRSAGNAHTELAAQYMNQKQGARYDINEILDLIDTVITAAKEKTSWGYSIPYFIAGIHNAHTFNVKQLLKRHNLKSKDLQGIIEKLDDVQKKSYDYALLEKLYIEYFDKPVDDLSVISYLEEMWKDRTILLLAPGRSVQEHKKRINAFVTEKKPVIIGVNNLIDGYFFDYIFYSSAVRYQNLPYQNYKAAGSPKIILSSNIKENAEAGELIVSYRSLIKFGWVNLDSSAILLMRLLQRCGVDEIYIAGMDGYKDFGEAFYKNELDTGLDEKARNEHTCDNLSMMKDMKQTNPNFALHFLTESVYEKMMNES